MEKYSGISSIQYIRKSNERVLTGFSDLDYFIKGLEIGITLLVANTNSGKSTFCQGVLAQAIIQGYKTWVFSGEHTAESFLQLIYHQNSTKKDYVPITYKDYKGRETNIADWFITEKREKEIRAIFDGKMFIYSNKAPRNIESIIDSMTECLNKEGARFFLIDNLISIDNINSNVFAEQTRITEKIRTFALNNKVIVLLVAHQRKKPDGGFRIDIQDVAGSQNICNKAYNVIAQYRIDMLPSDNREYKKLKADLLTSGYDISKCDNVIEVLKTKGTKNGVVGLKYDSETKTYNQAEKLTDAEANKLYKKNIEQVDLDDLKTIDIDVEDGDLPF